ncbi:MAG: hypothetical protein ACE37H_06010 [Phycisphaeraceae bacterium]
MRQPPIPFATLAAAVLLFTGCSNPYLSGFTGAAGVPMPDNAPVAVIGANRADPLQMRRFDQAMADAKAGQKLLGSSTIVSASPLRDTVAADAGRELGATLVLYNFKYLNSTVERDTQSYRRFDRSRDTYYDERRSWDTTQHWYEYRAYFFSDKPRSDSPEPSAE